MHSMLEKQDRVGAVRSLQYGVGHEMAYIVVGVIDGDSWRQTAIADAERGKFGREIVDDYEILPW